MRDSSSVITAATDGITKELAHEYEVSMSRIYEMLGDQCVYPKAKKLIRRIAACDKSADKRRVRLIKADLDALFAQLLGESAKPIDAAIVHKEASETVQAILNGEPAAVIVREAREMVSAGEALIEQLDKGISKDEVKGNVFTGMNGH